MKTLQAHIKSHLKTFISTILLLKCIQPNINLFTQIKNVTRFNSNIKKFIPSTIKRKSFAHNLKSNA